MTITSQLIDTLTPFHLVITSSLILIASVLGVSAPIVKGEVHFNWGNYIVSIGTSILVGFIVFLFLKTYGISDEYIAGTCGLFSYFGTKTVNILYEAVIAIIINRISNNDKSKKD